LRVGDRILAADGRELRRRPLARVLQPQPTHCFRLLRLAPSRVDALPLSAAAKQQLLRQQGRGWRPWSRGGSRRTSSKSGGALEVADDQLGTWFGELDARGPSVAF